MAFFAQDDGSLGVFQPVSKAIDDGEKGDKKVVESTGGAQRETLQSESVLYLGYYSSHEQTVDEQAERREDAVRKAIKTTLEKTATRCQGNAPVIKVYYYN